MKILTSQQLLFLTCILILSFNTLFAEDNLKSTKPLYGRAPYAILDPNFSCSAYQASTADIGDYGIAFLWNTFGNDFTCLNQELNSPRVKLVEVHLFNGPCIRNKNCGKYETLSGYTIDTLKKALRQDDQELKQKVTAVAKELADYLLPKLNPDIQCYINPILETDIQVKGSEKIQSWIEPAFNGRCKFVWNPLGSEPGAPIPGADVSEGHGQFPKFINNNCIANPDGTVISSVEDWKNYFLTNKNCVAVLGWTQNDNCLLSKQSWIDPRARACSDTSQFENLRLGIIAAQNK